MLILFIISIALALVSFSSLITVDGTSWLIAAVRHFA